MINYALIILVNYSSLGVKVTQSKTGSDRGPARTGPDRGTLIRSSVQEIFIFGFRAGPGPDRWTRAVDRIKWVVRSCPSARADHAPQKKRVDRTKRGGTVVPLNTVWLCPQKKRWHGRAMLPVPLFCLVHAQDRSKIGPALGLLGPIRSSVRASALIRSSVQTSPVRFGPGLNYTPTHHHVISSVLLC